MLRKLLNIFRSGSDPAPAFRPNAGQLLSVLTDEGSYGVMKLLAVDRAGVHGRLYVQRFSSRPVVSDLPELTLASLGSGQETPISIGHMPLSFRSFAGWQPELIDENGVVTNEELEGFRMWQEAKGGYF